MPNGDLNDFWNYVHDMGDDLHKGAPKHFFYQNQKTFLTKINDQRKSERGMVLINILIKYQ